jgi:hypothetical protein
MNNTWVVQSCEKMGIGMSMMDSKEKSKFNSYELGPSNIAPIFVPTRVKALEIPFAIKDDSYTPGGMHLPRIWQEGKGN